MQHLGIPQIHLQISSNFFLITIGNGMNERELYYERKIIHYEGTHLELQQKFHSKKRKNDSIETLS